MLETIQIAEWRLILRQNFTQWTKLADFLELDPSQRTHILRAPHFPLNLPLRLAKKIRKGNLDDPILRQFLPTVEEEKVSAGFIKDPVGDGLVRCAPKLLHKYEGRVLLVCTSACAMHCRYCFRQNFDYEVKEKEFEKELAFIAADPSINEVILSGGDPLSLSNERLESLLRRLEAISHIKKVRFHTRFPIGIPERIDPPFVELLSSLRFQLFIVIHANVAEEVDDDVVERLARLRKGGAVILNQAVLLRGVNDRVDVLQALCHRLIDSGILPYYLHQLDKVQGAGHFEVTEEEGKVLMKELARHVPGYGLPRYAKEISGESGKTLIDF